MPWACIQKGNAWLCVEKGNEENVKGRHTSKADCEKQLAALYANTEYGKEK